MNVVVLGLGPMGQALAGALLSKGFHVTVSNRTMSKATELVARGAVAVADPAVAVAAGDIVLINVVDHAAVDALLETAGAAVAERLVIGLSSDTPERAVGTAALAERLGGRYLDGAIMTPTITIGTPEASILFAGPRSHFEAASEVLAALGTPTWLGTGYDRAAAYDMALLDIFWTAVGGFLHATAVARHHEIAPTELLPHALGITAILAPIFTELAQRVEADRHADVSAPVASVAASLRHLVVTSREAGVDAGMLQAFARHVDRAVEAGLGASEISAIATVI